MATLNTPSPVAPRAAAGLRRSALTSPSGSRSAALGGIKASPADLSLALRCLGSRSGAPSLAQRIRCDAANPAGPSGPGAGTRGGAPESRSSSAAAAASSTFPLSSDATQRGNTHGNGQAGKPKFVTFDYGFQAEFLHDGPSVPGSVFRLAMENFGREYQALRRNLLFEEPRALPVTAPLREKLAAALGRASLALLRGVDNFLTLYDGISPVKPLEPMAAESEELRKRLQGLKLTNEAVAAREEQQPKVPAPWYIFLPYYSLCVILDVVYNHRPIQRFWFLETVARMPYFSYISMLHLYETLGWWRVGAEVRKVHFAEEWNEMNHLRIMESLGGDRLWFDRFCAQHAAFFYYWVLNGMFLLSPTTAYNFSELVETHAADTYAVFVDENEELLKSLPPSPVALDYYENEDLYIFDDFQTEVAPGARRPKIESLYDVFAAIRDDEVEHVKTMSACQKLNNKVCSPHRRKTNAMLHKEFEKDSSVDGHANNNVMGRLN